MAGPKGVVVVCSTLLAMVPNLVLSILGALCPHYLFIPLPHPPQVIDVQLRFHILLSVEGNKRNLGWQGDCSHSEERSARTNSSRKFNGRKHGFSHRPIQAVLSPTGGDNAADKQPYPLDYQGLLSTGPNTS